MTVFPKDLDLRGRRVRLRGPVEWFDIEWFDSDSIVLTIPLDAEREEISSFVQYLCCQRNQGQQNQGVFVFQNISANAAKAGEDIVEVLPAQNGEEGS